MARLPSARQIPTYLLYGEPPQRHVGQMLHVETIEARSIGHHWKIAPHLHQVLHQMVVVLRGHGVVLAEGTRAQYRPPAVALIPAGSVHGFEFEPGTTGHVISMSDELQRELQRLEPGIGSLFSAPSVLEFSKTALRAADLERSVRALAREAGRNEPGMALARHGWLQILLAGVMRLAQERPDPADPATGKRRQLVQRFSELVERRFRNSQSVAAYATALHVSESRLRNACLEVTGRSPIQLIHARLLLEAKRQLHYTDTSVREIAYTLGFDDPAYFTRFFTLRAGVSPRTFRTQGPESTLSGSTQTNGSSHS